jgi:hypothetical protein
MTFYPLLMKQITTHQELLKAMILASGIGALSLEYVYFLSCAESTSQTKKTPEKDKDLSLKGIIRRWAGLRQSSSQEPSEGAGEDVDYDRPDYYTAEYNPFRYNPLKK